MKILAIMGSPRKMGNTYQLTKKFEESMKQYGAAEFDYIFLKDMDLKTCLGCQTCFDKGEELCPLKDDGAVIEEKMHKADAVIFTSPIYVFNVSGLMKNFMDRLGYVCHRPRFFKSAMILTTSGLGIGSGEALKPFKLALQVWGFKVIDSFDIVTNGDPKASTPGKKIDQRVGRAAEKLHSAIQEGRPKPNILTMIMFLFAKEKLKETDPGFYDHHYWKDNGWLESGADYYHDIETNFIKKGLAKIASKFMGLVMFH